MNTNKLIEMMADEFCRWPLPNSVCADGCACQTGYPHRTGTNLLTVIEAAQMMTDVVGPHLIEMENEIEELREEIRSLRVSNAT